MTEEEIHKLWERYDTDNSGTLAYDEVQELLNDLNQVRLGPNMDADDLIVSVQSVLCMAQQEEVTWTQFVEKIRSHSDRIELKREGRILN